MEDMVSRATESGPPCDPAPALGERSLISPPEAMALERTFKVLANGTRLRLLHALVLRPGISVTELARTIRMKPQAVSNQLQRLTDKGILGSVRDGTSVRYRVVDRCVVGLLDQGLCLTEDTWQRQRRRGRSTRAA
jgi:ArsR family transcriptional regulator, lead/cadmium/zinc/bismuth-responsive transcriptional repressor